MKLSELKKLLTATITEIQESTFLSKLFESGIVPGAKVTVIRKAPFRGPVYIKVDNSLIALRRSEADTIIVE